MARFLITGANGQVGKCLVEQLHIQNNVELLALDKYQLDITNKASVQKIITQFHPDIVINAAAYTAVDKAEKNELIANDVNILGAKYLAEESNRIGAAILHISTDYVFSGFNQLEYKEDDLPDPQSVYGLSKLNGELAVLQANLHSIILRTAWVFGLHGNNFVKTMINLAKTKQEISIVGDQFGGPTYAGDIASALIKISNVILSKENKDWGIYHFSGKPYVSWFEFAEAIFNAAKQQGVVDKIPSLKCITTDIYPTLAKRPQNSRLNLDRINDVFEIKPSDWQKGLNLMIQQMRN